MPNPIVIVPYDPSWPAVFEILSSEIGQLLGNRINQVHHVGSTAVPGLAAKPKIDLIAELASADFLAAALSHIQALKSFQFTAIRMAMVCGLLRGAKGATVPAFIFAGLTIQ